MLNWLSFDHRWLSSTTSHVGQRYATDVSDASWLAGGHWWLHNLQTCRAALNHGIVAWWLQVVAACRRLETSPFNTKTSRMLTTGKTLVVGRKAVTSQARYEPGWGILALHCRLLAQRWYVVAQPCMLPQCPGYELSVTVNLSTNVHISACDRLQLATCPYFPQQVVAQLYGRLLVFSHHNSHTGQSSITVFSICYCYT